MRHNLKATLGHAMIAACAVALLPHAGRAQQPRGHVYWGVPCTAQADPQRCDGGMIDPGQIQPVARLLAEHGGGSEVETASRLSQLLQAPGASLYLDVQRSDGFTVILRSVDAGPLRIDLPGADPRMRGGLRSEILEAERPNVHVLLVRGAAHNEYVIEVPPMLTTFTLVVNGDAVVTRHRVDHGLGEHAIRVHGGA